MKNSLRSVLQEYEKAFNQIYVLNSIINILKEYCEEKEFKSQYYGLKPEEITNLSTERNHYINILSLLSDKSVELMSSFVTIEDELTLYQNTDNCRRHPAG